MRAAYPFEIHEEEGRFWAQGLPPLDGVFTEAADLVEMQYRASDALTLALGSILDAGEPVPRPQVSGQTEHLTVTVEPDPRIVAALLLRWTREDAKITQAELAGRLNLTRQAIQKLERSDANPSLKTLGRVFRALGHHLYLATES